MNEIWLSLLNVVEQFTTVDYLIIVLLIIYAIGGFRRGFALSFIHLTWLLLAFVFAGNFYQTLGSNRFLWFLSEYHLLNFILLFTIFFIFKFLLYQLLQKNATIKGVSWFNAILNAEGINNSINNFFGILLGLLKGGIIVVLIIVALHQYNITALGVVAGSFNAVAIDIRSTMSYHLTFIKK